MKSVVAREENGGSRSRKEEELQLREIEGLLEKIKVEIRSEGKKGERLTEERRVDRRGV